MNEVLAKNPKEDEDYISIRSYTRIMSFQEGKQGVYVFEYEEKQEEGKQTIEFSSSSSSKQRSMSKIAVYTFTE